jgi:myo-inositol 2-dehydrogenase / D-chiro-inositol 1-dehydrogenase
VHDFDIVPWLLGAPVVEASWHAPRPSSQAVGLRDRQLNAQDRRGDGAGRSR